MTLSQHIKATRPGWNTRKMSEHIGVPYTTLYDWWHTRRAMMECLIRGLP